MGFFILFGMSASNVSAVDLSAVTAVCDPNARPCTAVIGDLTVVMDISPKPVTAMTDLEFQVTLKGRLPDSSPTIDLGMPGMKMGPNRVNLKAAGSGVYTGNGVIVRCPSGKRVWFSKITVPDNGTVEFTFDVVY